MLKKSEIIRAWKDRDYFLGLSESERAALPANPAGLVELSDDSLDGISGGTESTVEACSVPKILCNTNSVVCTGGTQQTPYCTVVCC